MQWIISGYTDEGVPMNAASVDELATTLGTVGDLIAGIREDQWHAPTPCPEWNVRQLVNHMVMGNRLFASILRGEAVVQPEALDPEAGDQLGGSPEAAYRESVQDLVAAFRRQGVLDQLFQVPVGTVPGIAALHLRMVEDLVHGWDVARATDQQLRIPDEIVQQEWEFSRDKLADVPPDRSPFAPSQPVPEHASPLDGLAALLGRAVGTPH